MKIFFLYIFFIKLFRVVQIKIKFFFASLKTCIISFFECLQIQIIKNQLILRQPSNDNLLQHSVEPLMYLLYNGYQNKKEMQLLKLVFPHTSLIL